MNTQRQQDNFELWQSLYPAEATWLVDTAGRWDLAASLLNQVQTKGYLSDKQVQVIRNGIARDAQRNARPAPATTPVDMTRITEAFNRARSRAAEGGDSVAWLKLRLDTFVFSDAPATLQWPKATFVKEGDTKLGRIVDGKFLRSRECDDATQTRIVAAAQDPEAAATAYGLKWKCCSVCGRTLTAEESRERAIGPICYAKFFGG